VSALPEGGKVDKTYVERFMSLINNDLAMPQAMALMWELLGSALSDADKKATARYFDHVFGLVIDKVEEEEIPREILELVELRLQMKKQKEYQQADEIRQKVTELGYRINDAGDSSTVSKQG
jgi:cysteinyl-tRNA synthetase